MATCYSRNKNCDTEHWIGENALGGFEEFVLTDMLMDLQPLDVYEEAIENSWPAFIADSLT